MSHGCRGQYVQPLSWLIRRILGSLASACRYRILLHQHNRPRSGYENAGRLKCCLVACCPQAQVIYRVNDAAHVSSWRTLTCIASTRQGPQVLQVCSRLAQLEDQMPCVLCLIASGDAMGVFHVWQFLDSWGIINYQAPTPPSGTADEGGLDVRSAGKFVSKKFVAYSFQSAVLLC